VEALMLNYQGEVAECTGENIFIVRDQQLLTPPLEAGILHGITRGTVMELARNDGIDVVEPTISLDDLYGADECFLTGSAAEVVPVIKVDGNVIGDGTPGPITARLTGLFRQAVQQDTS
jgi:branched-chain amino acid aminotransferase